MASLIPAQGNALGSPSEMISPSTEGASHPFFAPHFLPRPPLIVNTTAMTYPPGSRLTAFRPDLRIIFCLRQSPSPSTLQDPSTRSCRKQDREIRVALRW